MTFAVPARSLRLVGWALPILAMLCCAPSVARAGCGDYVVTRAPHPADFALGGTPGGDAARPGSPHKPCHGPNCSRGPAVPTPLSAPTVTPTAPSEWGWLAGDPGAGAPPRGGLPRRALLPRPTHLTSGIFHPPRRGLTPVA